MPKPNSIKQYLTEISRYELLTHPEQLQLARSIKSRDENAARSRERMINCNLRLVVKIVGKYARWDNDNFLDLIQSGNLGLERAIDLFNPDAGFRFSTYATYWIKQKVLRERQTFDRGMQYPSRFGELRQKARRVRSELEKQFGRKPTLPELAASLEVDIDKAAKIQQTLTPISSLDLPVGEGSDTLGCLLATSTESPEDVVDRRLNKAKLEEMISFLPPINQQILKLRSGIDCAHPHRFPEIGETLGISPQKSKNLYESSMKRLWTRYRKPDSALKLSLNI